MAWDGLKMDCYRRIPGGLILSEYFLKNHGVDVPEKRSGQLKGVMITGLPVIMAFDDSKECVRKIISGEISLIPHFVVSMRSAWQLLDINSCWRRSDRSVSSESVCIAAVVHSGIGVPEMYSATAFRDAARIAAYVIKQNKLDVNAVKTTSDCPDYITSRWKEFKQELRTQYKRL